MLSSYEPFGSQIWTQGIEEGEGEEESHVKGSRKNQKNKKQTQKPKNQKKKQKQNTLFTW